MQSEVSRVFNESTNQTSALQMLRCALHDRLVISFSQILEDLLQRLFFLS